MSGRHRAADFDRRRLALVDELGMFDHDDSISAARHHAAGRDRRRRTRRNFERGLMPADDHFAIEMKAVRRAIGCANCIG